MAEPKKDFSPTEVGSLVESFRHEIRLIAEKVDAVQEDVISLKNDMAEVKTDLAAVKDAIRITVPSHEKRIGKLESKVGA